MAYAMLDDMLWANPTIMGLTDGAQALLIRATSYCANQLLDGFVPQSAGKLIGLSKRYSDELVAKGVWEWHPAASPLQRHCGAAAGWLQLDWQKWMRSRGEVLQKRDQQKQRVGRFRNALHSGSEAAGNAAPIPKTNSNTKEDSYESSGELVTVPLSRNVTGSTNAHDSFVRSFAQTDLVWDAMSAAYEKVRAAKLSSSARRGSQFVNWSSAVLEAAQQNAAASGGLPEFTVESVLRVTFRAFYAGMAGDEWPAKNGFPLKLLAERFGDYFVKGRFAWETEQDWSLKQVKHEQSTGNKSFSTAQSSLSSGGRR